VQIAIEAKDIFAHHEADVPNVGGCETVLRHPDVGLGAGVIAEGSSFQAVDRHGGRHEQTDMCFTTDNGSRK
jgi:hypothetical protein